MIDTRQRFRLTVCETSASIAEYASIAKGNAKARCKALYLSAGFGDFGRLTWGILKSVVDAWTKGVCGVDILPIHT